MPIIDRQRRLVEAGRIRLGDMATGKGGKTYPSRLDKWRLTSRDETKIVAAAQVYGGTPRPWENRPGEWELYTESNSLNVYLIPNSMSAWYELWGKTGDSNVHCLRRCDGRTEMLSDTPCLCGPTRAEDAKTGDACRPTTRLSVLLPDVPGIGSWLLVTRGEIAADELGAMSDLLHEVSARGEVVPARLRIDTRRSTNDGQTTVYPVPVLDLDISPATVLAIAQSGPAPAVTTTTAKAELPPADYTPAPPPPSVSVDQALESVQKLAAPRKTSTAPIGAPGPDPSSGAVNLAEDGEPPQDSPAAPDNQSAGRGAKLSPPAPPPADDTRPKITAAQRKKLFAVASDAGLAKEDVRTAVERVTGQSSTAVIAKDDFDKVLVELGELQIEQAKQGILG